MTNGYLKALALGLALAFAPQATLGAPTPASSPVQLDRIEGGMIFFKVDTPDGQPPSPPPSPIDTGLFDLNYLGALQAPSGMPYFLVSAKPCPSCQDDRSVHAWRPGLPKPSSFAYPGKVLDPKTRALLFESRAFYGKCLPGRGEVYVSFQRERIDRRRYLQESVFVSEAGPHHLEEQLIERRVPKLSRTLQLVKSKQCKEIEGRNRMMTAKKVNLRPQDTDDDEDDDDSPPRENQSDRDMPESQGPPTGT